MRLGIGRFGILLTLGVAVCGLEAGARAATVQSASQTFTISTEIVNLGGWNQVSQTGLRSRRHLGHVQVLRVVPTGTGNSCVIPTTPRPVPASRHASGLITGALVAAIFAASCARKRHER